MPLCVIDHYFSDYQSGEMIRLSINMPKLIANSKWKSSSPEWWSKKFYFGLGDLAPSFPREWLLPHWPTSSKGVPWCYEGTR